MEEITAACLGFAFIESNIGSALNKNPPLQLRNLRASDTDVSFIYSETKNENNVNNVSCKYLLKYWLKAIIYSILSLLMCTILILIPLNCNNNKEKVNFWLYFFVYNLWFSFFNAIGLFYCFYGAIPGVTKYESNSLWIFQQIITIIMGIIIYYIPSLQSFTIMLRIYNGLFVLFD